MSSTSVLRFQAQSMTQDLEELLLSDGPTSVSHLRSLTFSDAELAPSYDYQISASPCDQPMVKIDELAL